MDTSGGNLSHSIQLRRCPGALHLAISQTVVRAYIVLTCHVIYSVISVISGGHRTRLEVAVHNWRRSSYSFDLPEISPDRVAVHHLVQKFYERKSRLLVERMGIPRNGITMNYCPAI